MIGREKFLKKSPKIGFLKKSIILFKGMYSIGNNTQMYSEAEN